MRLSPFALILLAGCITTPSELRELEVVGTFQTSKSADAVATCIADAFAVLGAPLIADRETGKTVSFNYNGSTVMMFTIAPGGTVTVQRANSLLAYRDKIAPCL